MRKYVFLGCRAQLQGGLSTCQAAAKPTYFFSTPTLQNNSIGVPTAVSGGRHLLQTTTSTTAMVGCNQIGYYQACGALL